MNTKICLWSGAFVLGLVLLVSSPAAAVRWTPLGPPDGATVLSLAYDPVHSNIVYAGTVGGGVVKSLDGGRTWAYASLGLGEPMVRALAVDLQDPRNVYAGTNAGLFRSRDRGRTWLPSTMKLPVDAIAVDPLSAGSLYIGTRNGMFRSYDGGLRWVAMGQGLVPSWKPFPVPSLVVAPSRPRTLYAAHHFDGQSGVFRSLDGGKSWTRILRARVTSLAVDPADAAIVYASEGTRIRMSADGGKTWSMYRLPEWVDDLYMGSTRTICATTAHGALWSYDQGRHWEPIPGLPDREVWTMAFDPKEPETMLAGTAGVGVYRSDDGGQSWQSSSAGLVNFAALAVAVVTDPPALLTGGFSGLYRTVDGGITWDRVLPDVTIRSLAVDPSDPATVYAGGGYRPYGEDTSRLIFKSTDGGITWTPSATGITRGPIMSLAIAPGDPQTVYAGASNPSGFSDGKLFRSKDGGATWAEVPGIGGVLSIAFDPTDAQVIYITQGRSLFHSRNGGRTWTQRFAGAAPPLRARQLRGVAVSPANPDRLAVVDAWAVFLSFDTGKTWVKSRTCRSDCWTVTFHPQDADVIYAGITPGVLRTLDGGDTWQSLSKGLPGVDVYNLAFDPAEPTRLYVGTGSAGVFRIDLAQ